MQIPRVSWTVWVERVNESPPSTAVKVAFSTAPHSSCSGGADQEHSVNICIESNAELKDVIHSVTVYMEEQYFIFLV